MPSPQYFDGHAMVSWSDHDITVAVPWYIGLMFRTRQRSTTATLMQANAGSASQINLQVSKQQGMDMFCLNRFVVVVDLDQCFFILEPILSRCNLFISFTLVFLSEFCWFLQRPHNAFPCVNICLKVSIILLCLQ